MITLNEISQTTEFVKIYVKSIINNNNTMNLFLFVIYIYPMIFRFPCSIR